MLLCAANTKDVFSVPDAQITLTGKSTELLRRVRRHLAAARKCLLIKYKGDTRYGQEPVLTTHDMVHMVAKSVTALSEADNAAWHYDVIAVDEGQFFPGSSGLNCGLRCSNEACALPVDNVNLPRACLKTSRQVFKQLLCVADLVDCIDKWANDGKTVLVSALDATFQAKPFMNVLQLIPLAEHVVKLTAICTGCRKEASFTKRLSSETDVEVSPYVFYCICNVLCTE